MLETRLHPFSRTFMLLHLLAYSLRKLIRDRFYSLVNVVGLGLGMACCLLLLLYVLHELSFDAYHPRADDVYFLRTEDRGAFPSAVGPLLEESLPEVERAGRLVWIGRPLLSHGDAKTYEVVHLADPGFLDIMHFDFVRGNAQDALARPNSMMISTDVAARVFGDDDPTGKALRWDTSHDYTVTGVFEVPEHSHLTPHVLGSMSTLAHEPVYEFASFPEWEQTRFSTYLRLRNGADPETVLVRIDAQLQAHGSPGFLEQMAEREALELQPLTHMYLDAGDGSRWSYVYLLSAVAALVLLIACVNFINLTTARAVNSGKEVGLRKAIGAHRSQLIVQFLGESALLVALAGVLAAALVALCLSPFETFVDKDLTLSPAQNPTAWLAVAGILLATGLVGGLYPAFVLSSHNAARAMRGTLRTGPRAAFLRRRLVEFQFVISLFLLITTAIVYRQVHYIQVADIGFDREQVIVMPTAYPGVQERAEQIMASFRQVRGVVASSYLGVEPLVGWYREGDTSIEGSDAVLGVPRIGADAALMETLGLQLVAGRNVSAGPSTGYEVLINETAVDAFGLGSAEQALGRIADFGNDRSYYKNLAGSGEIVGVLQDFHFDSLHEPMIPVLLVKSAYQNQLLVRLESRNVRQTLDGLAKVWHDHVPAYDFQYTFLSDNFDASYRGEQRLGKILGVFAVMAIVIACLGVFALATFTVEQRTRELGVRKSLGASAVRIVMLISREITWRVIVANVVAWPLALLAVRQWLDRFAYHVDVEVSVFAAGGVAVLGVAWLTVLYHAVQAVRVDPVVALRSE